MSELKKNIVIDGVRTAMWEELHEYADGSPRVSPNAIGPLSTNVSHVTIHCPCGGRVPATQNSLKTHFHKCPQAKI